MSIAAYASAPVKRYRAHPWIPIIGDAWQDYEWARCGIEQAAHYYWRPAELVIVSGFIQVNGWRYYFNETPGTSRQNVDEAFKLTQGIAAEVQAGGTQQIIGTGSVNPTGALARAWVNPTAHRKPHDTSFYPEMGAEVSMTFGFSGGFRVIAYLGNLTPLVENVGTCNFMQDEIHGNTYGALFNFVGPRIEANPNPPSPVPTPWPPVIDDCSLVVDYGSWTYAD